MGAEGIEELRVIHCLTPTGGNPKNLANSKYLLGLKSWALTFHTCSFKYNLNETLFFPNTYIWWQQVMLWRIVFGDSKSLERRGVVEILAGYIGYPGKRNVYSF